MNLVPPPVKDARQIITQFIRSRVEMADASGVVVGLSGGLDSAVSMSLAVSALGPERVFPIFLPYGDLGSDDLKYARRAAESVGCGLRIIDISPVVDSIPLETDGMVKGNIQARARMIILYAAANMENLLVLGTSNKTELMLGYYTKFGDGASDMNPIGDLLKTQVRHLAAEIGIPDDIISRTPSAGLIRGQTDEGELKLPYPILDQIIRGYLQSLPVRRIAENVDCTTATEAEMKRAGFEPPLKDDDVESIIGVIRGSMHKRSCTPIPKLGSSTIGVDLRERW
ncbi:MAG: NAD(+) synthase [Thermoplasmatota archaeon]